MELKWHASHYDFVFMDMAKSVSRLSKDPSTQVGAVIVSENRRDISIGYNGFPSSVPDDEAVLQKKAMVFETLDKYDLMIHAEVNAILHCANAKGATLYSTHMPCANCAKVIVQAGIRRVVTTRRVGKSDLFYEKSSSIFYIGGVDYEYLCVP